MKLTLLPIPAQQRSEPISRPLPSRHPPASPPSSNEQLFSHLQTRARLDSSRHACAALEPGFDGPIAARLWVRQSRTPRTESEEREGEELQLKFSGIAPTAVLKQLAWRLDTSRWLQHCLSLFPFALDSTVHIVTSFLSFLKRGAICSATLRPRLLPPIEYIFSAYYGTSGTLSSVSLSDPNLSEEFPRLQPLPEFGAD